MATLAEVRTRVRTWLEDSGASPLWSDEAIDEGLNDALIEFGYGEPAQKTTTITAAAGATLLTPPDDFQRCARLIDPNGAIVPQRAASAARYVADEEQSWEDFAGNLRLARPATAGDYTLWYEALYAFPATDATAWPTPADSIPLIIAGACYWALQERAVQEWKRGPLPARYQERITSALEDYHRLQAARRRRVRTSTVEVSG